MDLLIFPPEIWTKILRFTDVNDLMNMRLACKTLKESVDVESVWQSKCLSILNKVQLSTVKTHSFRILYKEVLHKYGYLLGTWAPDFGCYGGLITIEFNDGNITAYLYECPSCANIQAALKKKPLFRVSYRAGESSRVQCLDTAVREHNCDIIKCYDKDSGMAFEFKCRSHDGHELQETTQQLVARFRREHGEDMFAEPLLDLHVIINRQETMLPYRFNFLAKRLTIPKPERNAVIQPGMFKGTYSAHGVELLMLYYEGEKAYLRKISGDPNVPAQEISVAADLNRPMILKREQQTSIDTLQSIDIADLPPGSSPQDLPPQPFYVPHDCYERESDVDLPSTCKARYHAKGQIAAYGFNDPSWTDSHWIIFDENTFAHLWIELRSISIYSRVEEDFT